MVTGGASHHDGVQGWMEVAGLQKDGGTVQTERFLKGKPVFASEQRPAFILHVMVILS